MGLQIVQGNEPKSRQVLAAVYARVSTVNVRARPNDADKRTYRSIASAVAGTVFDTYVDNGVSGKSDSRPALNRLMARRPCPALRRGYLLAL